MDYFTQLWTRICHVPFMLAGSLFVAWQRQFIEDSIKKSQDLHGLLHCCFWGNVNSRLCLQIKGYNTQCLLREFHFFQGLIKWCGIGDISQIKTLFKALFRSNRFVVVVVVWRFIALISYERPSIWTNKSVCLVAVLGLIRGIADTMVLLQNATLDQTINTWHW